MRAQAPAPGDTLRVVLFHDTAEEIPLARLARAGVWDLRLGERRVGTHLDDLPAKRDVVVFPAVTAGGLERRPVTAARVADVQLLGVGVALRVAVE